MLPFGTSMSLLLLRAPTPPFYPPFYPPPPTTPPPKEKTREGSRADVASRLPHTDSSDRWAVTGRAWSAVLVAKAFWGGSVFFFEQGRGFSFPGGGGEVGVGVGEFLSFRVSSLSFGFSSGALRVFGVEVLFGGLQGFWGAKDALQASCNPVSPSGRRSSERSYEEDS